MPDKNKSILDTIDYIPEEIIDLTLEEIMNSGDVIMSSTFNKDGSLRKLNVESTVDGFKINVKYKGPKRGR